VGLALNLLSLPAFVILESTSDALRRGGAPPLVANAPDFVGATWLAYIFPIVSLATLIYTASVDRHTRWWRTKTTLASIMLFLWLVCCAGFWLFFRFTEQ
jgi:hypothetical protein